MIDKITNLNKRWVIDQYFEKYANKISYQQIWEEYRFYFMKDKDTYSIGKLEAEIKQHCPELFSGEKIHASSIS
jgi:hypothetical protein